MRLLATIMAVLAPLKLGHNVYQVRATAYCIGSDGATSTPGVHTRFGIVAVPRGSWLYRRHIYVFHGIVNPRTGRRRRVFWAADTDPSGPMDVFLEGVHESLCGGLFPKTLHYRVVYP